MSLLHYLSKQIRATRMSSIMGPKGEWNTALALLYSQSGNTCGPGTGDTKCTVSVSSSQAQTQTQATSHFTFRLPSGSTSPDFWTRLSLPIQSSHCCSSCSTPLPLTAWHRQNLLTHSSPSYPSPLHIFFHLLATENWHPPQGCCLPCNIVRFLPKSHLQHYLRWNICLHLLFVLDYPTKPQYMGDSWF